MSIRLTRLALAIPRLPVPEMNTNKHRLPLIIAGSFAIAACNDAKPSNVSDALAQDSTLMLEVMLANRDSAANVMVDDSLPVTDEPPATEIAPAPAPTITPTPAPATPRPAAPAPRRTSPKPTITRTVSNTPSAKPASPREPVALRSTATVPAGTQLALESSRRVCVNNSNVGDSFSARTTENLIGPLGTVIPRGATATAVVAALSGSKGEERIVLEIRSISINGRVYPVRSAITDIELDRRRGAERCLPDDGRIVAELTQPLKIRL